MMYLLLCFTRDCLLNNKYIYFFFLNSGVILYDEQSAEEAGMRMNLSISLRQTFLRLQLGEGESLEGLLTIF